LHRGSTGFDDETSTIHFLGGKLLNNHSLDLYQHYHQHLRIRRGELAILNSEGKGEAVSDATKCYQFFRAEFAPETVPDSFINLFGHLSASRFNDIFDAADLSLHLRATTKGLALTFEYFRERAFEITENPLKDRFARAEALTSIDGAFGEYSHIIGRITTTEALIAGTE